MKFFFTLFVSLVIFTPSLSAQDAGLTHDNVEAFYISSKEMNITLKEGHDDLEQWLSYLDKNLASDYEYHTLFHQNCADEGQTLDAVGKKQLMDIYKKIGVNNYEEYDVTVQSIDISDDKRRADVKYTMDIKDTVRGAPLHYHCDGQAVHEWDPVALRAIVKSQRCEEHVVFGDIPDGCVKFDKWSE